PLAPWRTRPPVAALPGPPRGRLVVLRRPVPGADGSLPRLHPRRRLTAAGPGSAVRGFLAVAARTDAGKGRGREPVLLEGGSGGSATAPRPPDRPPADAAADLSGSLRIGAAFRRSQRAAQGALAPRGCHA